MLNSLSGAFKKLHRDCEVQYSAFRIDASSEELCKLPCAGILGQSRLFSGEKRAWDPSPGPAWPVVLVSLTLVGSGRPVALGFGEGCWWVLWGSRIAGQTRVSDSAVFGLSSACNWGRSDPQDPSSPCFCGEEYKMEIRGSLRIPRG